MRRNTDKMFQPHRGPYQSQEDIFQHALQLLRENKAIGVGCLEGRRENIKGYVLKYTYLPTEIKQCAGEICCE